MKIWSRSISALAGIVLAADVCSPSLMAEITPKVTQRVIVTKGAGYFPVLLRLNTGRLLVVYRYGAPHISVHGELAMSWSDDNGKAWSAPKIAVSGTNDHRNPAMGELPNGDILLAYCIMDGYDATGRKFLPTVNGISPRSTPPLWMVRSRDHGVTWSAPGEIKATQSMAKQGEFLNAFGKMTVTQDGSVLMSVYGTSAAHHTAVEHIFRSTDSGYNWTLLPTVAEHVNETAILALTHNRILAAARTVKEKNLLTKRSTDGGKTWTTPAAVTRPNEHPGDLIRLHNGDIFLSFGERNAPRGAMAMLSHDDGKTWDQNSRMVLADDAPIYDCGYPSSVQLPDGHIVTVYYKVDNAKTAPISTSLTAVIWELPKKSY